MATKRKDRVLRDGVKSRCINCKHGIHWKSEGAVWVHTDTIATPCFPGSALGAKPERTFVEAD